MKKNPRVFEPDDCGYMYYSPQQIPLGSAVAYDVLVASIPIPEQAGSPAVRFKPTMPNGASRNVDPFK